MKDTITQLRKTLIALLDDENGISEAGYAELQSLAVDIGGGMTGDIFNAVESSEGRYYLNEDHGLTADIPDTAPDAPKHQFEDCGGVPRCAKCGCDEDDAYVAGMECGE